MRRLGEDSNSWMADGSIDDKSKRLFMELLHQRPGHQSAEAPRINRGESYDMIAPSGFIPRQISLIQNLGRLRDRGVDLNASFAFGAQTFSDEQVNRLPGDGSSMGPLNHNSSLLSGNTDGGRSTQNEAQAFSNMFAINKDVTDMKTWNNVPPKNEGMGRMSFDAQERMGKQAALIKGEIPVTLSQQSSLNISGLSRYSAAADPYSDNLVGEDRRKDRLVVPSHGQDPVLLKRAPSSHSSSSHEGLLELMSDTANRAASSYSGSEGGVRRESGAAGNKLSEASSFSEMLKRSSSIKKVAAEACDPTEGSKGGGKKKGKKGRQIDPALLGFKVSSNRMLMGEIHRADDF